MSSLCPPVRPKLTFPLPFLTHSLSAAWTPKPTSPPTPSLLSKPCSPPSSPSRPPEPPLARSPPSRCLPPSFRERSRSPSPSRRPSGRGSRPRRESRIGSRIRWSGTRTGRSLSLGGDEEETTRRSRSSGSPRSRSELVSHLVFDLGLVVGSVMQPRQASWTMADRRTLRLRGGTTPQPSCKR